MKDRIRLKGHARAYDHVGWADRPGGCERPLPFERGQALAAQGQHLKVRILPRSGTDIGEHIPAGPQVLERSRSLTSRREEEIDLLDIVPWQDIEDGAGFTRREAGHLINECCGTDVGERLQVIPEQILGAVHNARRLPGMPASRSVVGARYS